MLGSSRNHPRDWTVLKNCWENLKIIAKQEFTKRNQYFIGTGMSRFWALMNKHVLKLQRFDLILQGALVIVLLLEANVYLLLRRDTGAGNVPSNFEEFVRLGSLVAEFIAGAAAAWGGRRRRQRTLAAWFGVTAGAALLVLAVPFQHSETPSVELCGGSSISSYSHASRDVTVVPVEPPEPWLVVRTIILVLTAVLCPLTRLVIWSHGFTYLDDHEPQNGAYFYGILVSIRLSLGLSGAAWLQPTSTTDTWWHAHLSLAMLLIMFAILFCLFPSRMSPDVDTFDESGFLEAVVKVLKNQFVLVQTAAMGLLHAGIYNFIYYDEAYVQSILNIEVYRQDPRSSRSVSNLFRPFVVIFFIMIFRVRFSQRRVDGVKPGTAARAGGVLALFTAGTLVALAAFGCKLDDLRGLSEQYSQPECSGHCGCSSYKYGFSPVCGVDAGGSYFSPCHAGCGQYELLNGFTVFENCTCGVQRFVRGSCSQLDCAGVFQWYQVVFTLLLAIGGSALLLQGMAVVRAVTARARPLALGVSFALLALATAAAHALFMLLSSLFCVFRAPASCALHGTGMRALPATAAALAALSAAISLLASRRAPAK